LWAPRIIIEPMEHRVWLRLCVVRTADFPVRALENVSLGEQVLETRDELDRKTFGWNLGERLDAEPNLEGFPTRKVSEVMEEIAEVKLVGVMG
jgi:hypothetical protein